jgi:hypothetical protein
VAIAELKSHQSNPGKEFSQTKQPQNQRTINHYFQKPRQPTGPGFNPHVNEEYCSMESQVAEIQSTISDVTNVGDMVQCHPNGFNTGHDHDLKTETSGSNKRIENTKAKAGYGKNQLRYYFPSSRAINTFMDQKQVSTEELNQVLEKFDNQNQWIEYKVCVQRRMQFQSVDFESYRRLRWFDGLSTLEKWLSDELINTFMAVLDERESIRAQNNHQHRRSYFLSTFLFPTFCREGHDGVKRWGRKSSTPQVNI